ncbi:hypothetical protein ACFY36_00915 [Actinoplanes sp. NPDC000266]
MTVFMVLTIAAVLLSLGLAGVVLRQLAGRPPAASAPAPEPDATEGERRQRLVEAAFLAGDIPAVWYRQQMAAIAADAPQPR